MKERPILFSASMVRAILAGSKSQTRRVAKPVKHPDFGNPYDPGALAREPKHVIERACPYGQPGDRLWVRETFAKIDGQTQPWIETDYRATYTHGDRLGDHLGIKRRWTPAIHMPRAASRITLEITDVRVGRLQEISSQDAIAEGIEPFTDFQPAGHWRRYDKWTLNSYVSSPVDSFASLWESINGPGSWDANPYVWAISFKRIST